MLSTGSIMTESHKTPIQRAIDLLGPSALAKAIGVTPQFITSLGGGERPVPPGRCIAIEAATDGRVTRYELRPDVFGSSPDKAA